MTEFLHLLQPGDLSQPNAPELRINCDLLDDISQQGKTISLYDRPLLRGLSEVEPSHTAAITLDTPDEQALQLPKLTFDWQQDFTTPIRIQVPLHNIDSVHYAQFNRELNASFWLGTLIGDAIGSGEALKINHKHTDRVFTAAAGMATVLLASGDFACGSAFGHSGQADSTRVIIGLDALIGFAMFRIKEHVRSRRNEKCVSRALSPRANELGMKFSAIHIGQPVETMNQRAING